MDKADIGKRGACHLFRHSMATLMLENGADIRFIQQMLGHADLNSTQIYTHVSIQKLKQIHTATHPARLKTNPAPPEEDEKIETHQHTHQARINSATGDIVNEAPQCLSRQA